MKSSIVAESCRPLAAQLKTRFDAALVRYDGWFLVVVAVVLALAATFLAGMAAWCVIYGNGSFTGNWYWKNGWEVGLECKR
ncbi:hypothetical protein SK1NUM_00600 [Arachnia rubra]|nr:hypothetical protein SK1NUM_00600 [Arachnia rubra]